jgi:hypothetical protein
VSSITGVLVINDVYVLISALKQFGIRFKEGDLQMDEDNELSSRGSEMNRAERLSKYSNP